MIRTAIRSRMGVMEVVAFLVISYSAYIAVTFAHQLPLDLFDFRQTQTALTAYWFTQEGFKWAYETPVGGYPWSIPFEFPAYQLLVSYFSQAFNVSLQFSGRIISYLFLFLIIFPVHSITRRLKLPDSVFVFFIVIFFSMPIYMYWGRTFMIETAALFFTIVAMKYFIDYLYGVRSYRIYLLFIGFSSLAILQKVTTLLPVLAILSFIYIIYEIKKAKTLRSLIVNKNILGTFVLIMIPIFIGLGWVIFTDDIKQLNPLGEQLTSAALNKWNWGNISQRMSFEMWGTVIWERMLSKNIGGVFGLFLLLTPFFIRSDFKIKAIVLSTLAFALIPLFLFTNLHIVHEYYQTANIIFLAYGAAVVLGSIILPGMGRTLAGLGAIMIVTSNYYMFSSYYLPEIQKIYTKNNNRSLAVGEILKRELQVGMQFIAFGNDWNSNLAYISQRKSFTVPTWFDDYEQVVSNPEKFVNEDQLGGVVSCSIDNPSASDFIFWANNERNWKIGETHGCLIATPEKKLEAIQDKETACQGSLDQVEIDYRDGLRVLSIAGWTATNDKKPLIPEDVFISISNNYSPTIYLQTLKVPRFDVNRHLGISDDIDAGFSRILPAEIKPGNYEVRVVQHFDGQYSLCGIKKTLNIE